MHNPEMANRGEEVFVTGSWDLGHVNALASALDAVPVNAHYRCWRGFEVEVHLARPSGALSDDVLG